MFGILKYTGKACGDLPLEFGVVDVPLRNVELIKVQLSETLVAQFLRYGGEQFQPFVCSRLTWLSVKERVVLVPDCPDLRGAREHNVNLVEFLGNLRRDKMRFPLTE